MTNPSKFFPYLVLITLFLVTRIPHLNSGLLPMEPDEATYFDVIYNYHHGHNFPTRNNEPFLSQPPLFPLLAYLAGFIFPPDDFQENYLASRLISVIVWLTLTLVFYNFVKNNFDQITAFFSTIFFILTPLGIFYSKLGTLDALLTTLIFLYFVFLAKKRFVIAGIFLALAAITKYTSLIFFVLPLLFLAANLLPKLRLTKKTPFWSSKIELEDFDNRQIVKLLVNYLTPIVIAAIVLIITLIPYVLKNAYVVKSTFLGVTIGHAVTSPKSFIENIVEYASKLSFWFSWPILLLSILGFIQLFFFELKKQKHFTTTLLFLILTIVFISKSPRAFLLLTPFILYLNAFSVELIREFLLSRKGPFSKLLLSSFLILLILPTIPSSLIALKSTNHNLLEKTAKIIRSENTNPDTWLFSTYWPGIMKHKTGLDSTWLTTQKEDARNWHASFPLYIRDLYRSSIDVLQTDGGWVLIEDLHTLCMQEDERIFWGARENARRWIEDNFEPLVTIADDEPNFPYTQKKNRVRIYFFENKNIKNQ